MNWTNCSNSKSAFIIGNNYVLTFLEKKLISLMMSVLPCVMMF